MYKQPTLLPRSQHKSFYSLHAEVDQPTGGISIMFNICPIQEFTQPSATHLQVELVQDVARGTSILKCRPVYKQPSSPVQTYSPGCSWLHLEAAVLPVKCVAGCCVLLPTCTFHVQMEVVQEELTRLRAFNKYEEIERVQRIAADETEKVRGQLTAEAEAARSQATADVEAARAAAKAATEAARESSKLDVEAAREAAKADIEAVR